MRFVLGFDGGGTKTECVLMNESRRILARSRSGPSNPSRIGLEAAFRALQEAAEQALTASGVPAAEVAAIHGGIAGMGVPELNSGLARKLKQTFPNAAVVLDTDLSVALAATQELPSLVVIAGTGSAAIGRRSPVRFACEGGLGPFLGDPGSAYDIGRKATVLGLRHFRNREDSPLGREILRAFHCNWQELQNQIRANAESVLPKIFPIVAKAANEGDTSAQAILGSAAEELFQLAAGVIQSLELQQQAFFLAKVGGVFGRSPFFDDPFDAFVVKIAPKVRIGPLPHPIAEFAALTAVESLDARVKNAG
jgi:N-acetylglucosamine kinase